MFTKYMIALFLKIMLACVYLTFVVKVTGFGDREP